MGGRTRGGCSSIVFGCSAWVGMVRLSAETIIQNQLRSGVVMP
jgi:hypothetical protein